MHRVCVFFIINNTILSEFEHDNTRRYSALSEHGSRKGMKNIPRIDNVESVQLLTNESQTVSILQNRNG